MEKKDMKYYFVYETTNLINGKKYRGAHQTEDMNDGYLGSGAVIVKAIKKYGKENFYRSIIAFYTNVEEMYLGEAYYIDYDWICRKDVYNLITGGEGGRELSKESKEKISKNTKEQMKDKKQRELRKEAMKNSWVDEDKVEKRKNKMKAAWTVERRNKQSEVNKKRMSDPIFKEKVLKAAQSKESKEKRANWHRGKKHLDGGHAK